MAAFVLLTGGKKAMLSSDKDKLQKKIGYQFHHIQYLAQALTHTSYSNENYAKSQGHLASNQRLEFLGDSVLSLVISTYLYEHFTKMPEGELSKLRAAIVCESSLAAFASRIELADYLLLGVGEDRTGGREKPSILADAFESLIAAIYLDGGMEEAKRFILSQCEKDIHEIAATYKTFDYKTNLQELMGKKLIKPAYEIIGTEGPEHDRFFIAMLTCGEHSTFGKGRSKKEAEQMAAKEMLKIVQAL